MKFDKNMVYGLEGGQLTKLAVLSDILKRSDDVEAANYIDQVLAEASPVFALAADEPRMAA